MAEPTEADPRAEPDPRIVRTHRVVRQAALDELAERGYGGFTIESVAARSGVAKSTIYRHWDGRLALIADALGDLNRQPVPAAIEGGARAQVTALVTHLATVFAGSTLGACVPALVEAAERDAGVRRMFHRYSAERRGVLVEVIRRGSAAGELPADLDADLAADALAGPIVYHRLLGARPLPPERVPALVALVLGDGA